jgi:tetratricopeptide (TPR) repeat protein
MAPVWAMKRHVLVALLPFLPVFGRADGPSPADFDSAVSLYQRGHYSESRRVFSNLKQQCPSDTRLFFYLARIALWFDDETAALTHLEKALELFPEDARLHNALGDAYGLAAQRAPLLSKLKWAAKCRAAYERAVELEPCNPAYRMSLLGYCLAAPRVAGGGAVKARAHAMAVAELDAAAGRVAWVTLHLAEGEPARAFALLKSALEKTPDDFHTLYQIGRCAAVSGQELERGEDALRKCLELPPLFGDGLPTHAHVQFRLGNILEKQGKSVEAGEAYSAATRLNPDLRPDKMVLKQ